MADSRLRSSELHADPERLRKQFDLSWPKERELLERLGLAGGMTVLDAGCGPGFLAETLLQLLPNSQIVAVDLDPDMTSLLRARVQSPRLMVVDAAAPCIDLPDECVDFAIARFLFQHLAGPGLAVSELHRLLRRDGRLAVVDVDDSLAAILDPAFPSFSVLGQKVAQLQSWRAGDRTVGRKLWRLLREASFEDLRLDTIAIHTDELGIEPFLPQLDPERYRPFIADGGLTQAEWEAYRDDLERFLASPAPYLLQLLFVVSGRK